MGGSCEPRDEAGQWLREELEEGGKGRSTRRARLELGLLDKLLETKENEAQGVGAMENICVQSPGLRKLKIPDVFCKMGPLCLGWGGERGS